MSKKREEPWFIAVAMGAWGRGRTIKEASEAMVEAGGKRCLKEYLVKKAPSYAEDPYVDEIGCIQASVKEGTTNAQFMDEKWELVFKNFF